MHSTKMFFSRNKLWAATHALLFDKFGDLRDGSTSLKPGVRVHSAVFPLARAKRLQRTVAAMGRIQGGGTPCIQRPLGRFPDRAYGQAPEFGGGLGHQRHREYRIRSR